MNQARLADDLVSAVDRGEISAWFQPQFDLATNRIVAVEALCRWEHPDLGLIGPAEFIPLAEEHGIISEIGRYMMEEGCRCAAEWLRDGIEVEVSVNVSALELATADPTDRLMGLLEQHDLTPSAVTIEITESQPIADMPAVVERLEELRARGLGVAIDDFGTGHSSILQLQSLPATELKLDQHLIRNSDENTRDLLASIVNLVHRRGLRVVAEGVETTEQLELARDLKCDRAQGYLLGMPVPEHQIRELLVAQG